MQLENRRHSSSPSLLPCTRDAALRAGAEMGRMTPRCASMILSIVGLSLVLFPCSWAAATSGETVRHNAAHEVFGRLLAPCCWTQTLDVHESESATVLRREIADRLRSGEQALVIEDDMAARYGERIRAVPRSHDTRTYAAAGVYAGMTLMLLVLWAVARRWVQLARGGPEPMVSELSREQDEQYEALLNRELTREDRHP
jgi:cytochrome c-type biogenesis protein CcmH